jgi:tetratricopeptide (TPR) repeat protein
VAARFERRFETLATEARLFLQTLALCAAPMPAAVICDASGIDHDRQSLIVTLRTSRLIRSSGSSDQIETYHDRIRESVSAGVPPQERRGIHGRIAAALRARHSDDVEALFEHCRGAGQLADAAEYAGQAGAKAAAALAFDRAATFYQQALDAASGGAAALPEWKRQLAAALTNAGRPAEAAAAYLRAASDANRSDQVAMQRAAAEQFLIGGHIDEGLGLLGEVLRSVGLSFAASPRRAVTRLLWHRARLAWRGLGFAEAREHRGLNSEAQLRLDSCWAAATGLGLVDIPRASVFITQHLHLALDAGDPARIARGMALEATARHADWIFRSSARQHAANDSNAAARRRAERVRDRPVAPGAGIVRTFFGDPS